MGRAARHTIATLVLALCVPTTARADEPAEPPAVPAAEEAEEAEEAEAAADTEATAPEAEGEATPAPAPADGADDRADDGASGDPFFADDGAGEPANDGVMWGGQIDGGAPRAGRKRKPFEPDTELLLTGDDLAARGATNLADALDLLPEVAVRPAGRGGLQADVRGSRRNWLKVLVDGIPVDDPYYGSFDISAIPVTDIVEIRLSAAPASPLLGFGGAGGVIEVTTVRALGERRLSARAQAATSPAASGWVTGRAQLSEGLGLRLSAGGTFGAQGFDVRMADGSDVALGEDRRAGNAALRLESATATGTVGLDLWVQKRGYTTPPGEDDGADVLVIDDEQMGRVSLWGEAHPRDWRVRGQGYFQLLTRDSRRFDDASLATLTTREALDADREGLSVAANRGLGAPGLELVLAGHFDTENADVDNLAGRIEGGRQSIFGAAAGLQWTRGAWRAHASAGAAIPDGATPWPEAKLSVGWAVTPGVDLEVIGARKGRLPTLRERYQLGTGNAGLDPEQASHGELRARVTPVKQVRVEASGYARWVEGMIRTELMTGNLANIGDVRFFGAELEVTTTPVAAVDVAASWRWIDAYSEAVGEEPLDFLPAHKVDGWVTWRFKKAAGATARVRWVDERVDQGMTLPTYVTADASGYYRVRNDLRATLKVDNVLDERYTVRANGYRDPGRVIMLGVEGLWE